MKKSFLSLSLTVIFFSIASAQWESAQRLTFNDSASHTSMNGVRSIAATSEGLIHVIFYDSRTGSDEIFYKRSTDNGNTWLTDTQLTNEFGVQDNPTIAVVGSIIHLVWEDSRNGPRTEVYYKRSTDDGLTWSDDIRITDDNAYSRNPAIAAQDSIVHITWADDSSGREIYYLRSTDQGITWSAKTRLTFDMQESWHPSIAVYANYVHLVWRDWRDHHFEVYYKRSTDYGVTWSDDVRLSEDPAGSYNPCIAVSNEYIHVIWWDTRHSPFEIYYKRSTDNGTSWEADIRLTNDTTGSYNPTLVATGSKVHVFWEALYGLSFIMYKYSTDYGSTWSVDTALTVQPEYWSVSPSSACTDSAVHIIWTDFRDNEYGEIYYKRNLTANVSFEEHSNYTFLHYQPITTIARGTFFIPFSLIKENQERFWLIDITGRKKLGLSSGFNDVRNLNPGIYFYRIGKNTKFNRLVILR